MLASSKVAEIRRLLVEDELSQRKIAELMGVSRGMVNAINAGRRPDYGPLQNPFDKPLPDGDSRRRVLDARPEAPPGLELRPDHQERYEEVRAAREEVLRQTMERIESDCPELEYVCIDVW